MTKRNYYLSNWIFICALVLLILNDHFFKWHFHNQLTGKLSDVVGLLLLPLFLAFCFPKHAKKMPLFSGIFFLFWKSDVSTPFIAAYNTISFIPITRVIDYSDYIALAILPLSYYIIKNIVSLQTIHLKPKKILVSSVFLASAFAFMATSPPKSFFIYAERYANECYEANIHIGKEYKIKTNAEEVLQRIKNLNYIVAESCVEKDSIRNEQDILALKIKHYKVENLVLKDPESTVSYKIEAMYFAIQELEEDKTLLIIKDVLADEPKKILTNWRNLKSVAKYYDKLIKTQIVKNVKDK